MGAAATAYGLRSWFLDCCIDGQVVARGAVYGNPGFPDGMWIHTSPILSVEMDENAAQLDVRTLSGSNYKLLLGEMCVTKINLWSLDDALSKFGVSFRRCLELTMEERKREEDRLKGILQPGEMLVRFSGRSAVSADFRTKDGEMERIPIVYHASEFSPDSVLVREERGRVDWRYFIWETDIEIYSWVGEARAVMVENETVGELWIRGRTKEILCPGLSSITLSREEWA